MKFDRQIIRRALVASITAVLLAGSAQAEPVRCAGCKTENYLIQHLAAPYQAAAGVEILPGGTGNKMAIQLFSEGKIDFAYTCKPHGKLAKKFKLDPATTANWVSTAIARDPIVVIANPACGVTGLSVDQLKSVFSGQVRNWKELGGADMGIVVVHLDPSVESGVVTVFKETTVGADAALSPLAKTLNAPAKLGEFTQNTPGAITFVGKNSYDAKYGTALSVNGISPEDANIINGSYPLTVTYHVVYDPTVSSEAAGFLGFCATQQGQDLINEVMVAVPQKNIVVP